MCHCPEKPIHTATLDGHTLNVWLDTTPTSPREWSETVLFFFDNKWRGDKKEYNFMDSVEDTAEYIAEHPNDVFLPIYIGQYETLSSEAPRYALNQYETEPDGYLWLTEQQVEEFYGEHTPETVQQAQKLLVSELTEYNHYLQGEVFGYTVTDSNGTEVDALWGHYGEKYAIETATEALERRVKQFHKKCGVVQELAF